MTPDGELDVVRDGVLRADHDTMGVSRCFLPSTTVQTHAANLLALPDGDLLCAWFGGTQEGVSDIDVWLSRLPHGSDTWTPAQRLSHDPERSEQNPVLFLSPTGALWLLWTAQHAGHQNTAEVRRRVSTDNGRTWSPQQTLFTPSDGAGVFIRHPPVYLDDRTWVLPIFRCPVEPGLAWSGNLDDSAVMVTRDAGTSWERHIVPDSVGCVHMTITPAPVGWQAFFRSRWADRIYRSTSLDALDWSAPAPTDLPNNNSSIQAAALLDAGIALVFNQSSAADATARRLSLYDEIDDEGLVGTGGERTGILLSASVPVSNNRAAFWGAPRAPLTLALSPDGEHWNDHYVLADGDGYCMTNDSRNGANHELSYPSVTQATDGSLHVAFSYHRRGIRHLRIEPQSLNRSRSS